MNKPLSTSYQFIAQLKNVELQIRQNQLQEAALQLNQMRKTAANDPRLYLLGAQLAEAANNPDGVLLGARKARQLAPGWPTATIYLAEVLASRGVVHEAFDLANLAVQEQSKQADNLQGAVELLGKAAAVVKQFKEYTLAMRWLDKALQIDPQDLGIQFKIAITLAEVGRLDAAINIYTELLNQRPGQVAVLAARLQAHLAAQHPEQAVADAQALCLLEPQNDVHRFNLALATGASVETLPAQYIADFFDNSAEAFDPAWAERAQYTLPAQVAQRIHQWHPDRLGDVLDLGCGTGLLGVALGPISGVLVGVDLSAKMIKKAALHQAYDSFHQVNLLDALRDTPAALYHVITALDVFNFVGNLEAAVPNAHRILLPDGHFVFSCETQTDNEADFALSANQRFVHHSRYIERLLAEAGFVDVSIQDQRLRTDNEQPVPGLLVTARKTQSVAG